MHIISPRFRASELHAVDYRFSRVLVMACDEASPEPRFAGAAATTGRVSVVPLGHSGYSYLFIRCSVVKLVDSGRSALTQKAGTLAYCR